MACQIAAIQMTLSDLQGHSPTAKLAKCDLPRDAMLATYMLSSCVCPSQVSEFYQDG